MSQDSHTNDVAPSTEQGTLKSYTIGFILSIGLTLVAYFLVVERVLRGWTLVTAIVGLAMVQLLVQLLFFLHLGHEARPRWKLVVFIFMLGVLGILVFGSLWIMQNLNYNMMPHDMDTHLLEEEGIR